MSIEKKLFSLGFAYNANGNVLGRRVLNQNPIPDGCFFKSVENGVEIYSRNPRDETMWDHVITSRDFFEFYLDETVTEQSILDL